MARPREFDKDEALDRAMDLFWLKGYEATSLQDLLEHMGIGRQSLYNTFGGKHDLFIAALDKYRNERLGAVLARLKAHDASLETIREVCGLAVEIYGGDPRSCFLANSTLELACQDDDVAQRARAYAVGLEDAFFQAVMSAMERGEIPKEKDPRSLARHLTNSVCGITVLSKAGTSRESLHDAMSVALTVLE